MRSVDAIYEVAATSLIAICERIDLDLTALHVILKFNELFDELVSSQETRIAFGTLERSSKVTKPKLGKIEIESCMGVVFLLYPSFASLLDIEKLSQGCATWLLLEQSLLWKEVNELNRKKSVVWLMGEEWARVLFAHEVYRKLFVFQASRSSNL
ncbi:hypothetical protein RHMOL_Rhmol03G0116500 [Rhododendron molle]|uniref:Uncharacterized protein n=1 Tax=Rhododendron molle TaxID=49168 RepID=A0ACC0PFP9_RHOML|nr:hypothetical protein RHMOL_Rhmol03G0116500 [Rhododendron molle]